MARYRTVRETTFHLRLDCNHDLIYTCQGWYPTFVLCCKQQPSLVLGLDTIADGEARIERDSNVDPPIWSRATDDVQAPYETGFRDYLVTIYGPERDNGDKPYWYAVNADGIGRAAAEAMKIHLQWQEEPLTAACELSDQDGMPLHYVEYLITGVPVHGPDTPGLAWNDLR